MEVTKLAGIGPYNNNVYIVTDPATNESVVIDASHDAGQIAAAAEGTRVKAILLTHGDHDHIDALEDLKARLKAPVGIHESDAARLSTPPDFMLADGQDYAVGSDSLHILHTPGHTPGCICLLDGSTLIAGDTLFPGGPGATRGDKDRFAQIIESITTKLFVLPDDTLVRPGHGTDTTIGTEKPHLQEWIDRGW
jgi:glyoxylase-like metal-dependent hydrolase (beta-lactamase superfamily II)